MINLMSTLDPKNRFEFNIKTMKASSKRGLLFKKQLFLLSSNRTILQSHGLCRTNVKIGLNSEAFAIFTPMTTLSDFDQLYKTTISYLPKEERLWYCTRSLDKLQLMLAKNSGLLDVELKENIRVMIEATQTEIKKLEKLK